ncbi:MAG: tandem-95 repeat protein [Gammaproteobacteria bacterium]|nr:tandem-95 repeat protein [Gammaproteobacteria bacterium]
MGKIGNANDIKLTDQQRAVIESRVAGLKHLLESQRYSTGFDESNPDHRLFFQSFDGTGNDRYNIPNDERPTNPGILEDLIYEAPSVRSEYRPGVGTDGGIDKLNYPGGGGATERAEEAYDQLREQAQAWHKENPDVDIHVSLAGFSRGSGSARHFANLVYERGVPAEDAQAAQVLVGFEHRGRDMEPVYEVTYDKYVIPPGEVKLDAMLLYDTVVTGQTQHMKLGIPPVQDLKVLHLTANDELRNQFDLESVIDPDRGFDPRLYEFGLPGAHSDIGGSYADNWLSARYLELGHAFLKQNGIPVRDIPVEHQASPNAVGVIHDPDELYFTTFGDRNINYSDNESVTATDLVSDEWLQQNLLARLEYIDTAYTDAQSALEWARAHPQDPEAASILAREAEMERDLGRLSDIKDQIFQSADFSLETMAEYNRRFADLQTEADRRMHEKEYTDDIATVSIFTEDGSLNRGFIASFNNADTFAEFLQSNAGLQLAEAGDDSVLHGEYAAFVYDKALTEAAARTGRDVSEILDLDVPGNPGAPGYHYQDHGQSSEGVSLADLARFLGQSEAEVLRLAADGGLSPALAGRQAMLQQSQGVQSSIYGGADLIRGLDDGDVLDFVTGLGRLGLGVDRLQDGFETGSGWLGDGDAAGLQAGLSAAAFLDDVLQGDEIGAVASGAYLVDHMDAALDDVDWEAFTDHAALGTGLSALSLYQGLDGGDTSAIAGSGFELANTLSDGALATDLGETFGLSEATPYAAYAMAGVQLVEGDVEQAGVTALSGYLMSTGHPIAVGAGVVLSLFGGSLVGTSTPKAWADFTVNADGSIGVDVDSNSTGDSLEEPVSSLAGMLAPVVGNVRSYGVEIKPEYLPRIGIREDEYYLQHGGGTRLITDPEAELPLLLEMNVIGHWMMENDIELWSRSGRHVYLGDTDWSHTVQGTGEFAGGGQKQYAPVTIDPQRIVSLNDPTGRTVARQLAEVTRTWRTDKSLFAGEGGALLAVGLGAGLVQYSEIAKAVDALPAPVSVTDHPGFAELLAGAGDEHVIAAGYGVVNDAGGGGDGPPGPPDEPNIDFAPFYSGRRTSVYDDALGRFDREAADRTDPIVPDDASDATGTLPVLKDGEAADPDEAAGRIRSLADDGASGRPLVPNGGDEGNSDAGADGTGPDTGERAAVPISHSMNVMEDRYLVTSTDRLLANDDGATFLDLGDTRNGVAALDTDGRIRFTPPPDFYGEAGFEYRFRSADGTVEIRQVAITVAGRNDRPHAGDDALAGIEDGTVELNRLLANDGDVDGDPIQFAAVGQAGAGQVEADDSDGFRYVPSPNYTGEVQWVYIIEDSSGARAAARTTLDIEEGENDPPVVSPVTLRGGVEEQAFAFHESELLDRAQDPEGGALQIQTITAIEGGAADWDRDSGGVVFTPAPDFHGRARLEFTVADPQGLATTGSADIEIANVPDPFTAGDTQLSVDQNQVIAFAPEDLLPRLDIDNPDGGEVAIVAARMVPGLRGLVEALPDGSVQWTPPPDYSGPSAFEVRLFNGVERIASRVDLDIAEVNDPPRTVADRFDAVEDQVFELNAAALLANDSDPEGNAFDVTAFQLLDPQTGVLSFDPATGDASLSPAPNFFGEARLEYTVTETVSGLSGTGHAVVDFAPVDDAPVITDKTFTLNEDETVDYAAGAVLGESVDVDGEIVSITAVRGGDPDQGAATLLASGGVRFTPAPDYFGTAGFEFDYSDGVTTGTANIDLVIKPVNDPPAGQSHRFIGALEDQPFELHESDFLAGASDVEGDAIHLDAVALAVGEEGQLDHDPDTGRIVYIPEADFHGVASLEYTLRDAHGAMGAQSAEIVVQNVEDDFALTGRSFSLLEDETRTFAPDELLDAPNDADGDTLTLTAARLDDPAAGRVELLADGSVHFVPESGFTGTAAFEFDVTDGTHTHTAIAGLQVAAAPEPPHYLTGAVEDQVFEFSSGHLPADVLAPVTGPVELAGIRMADPATGELAWNRETGDVVYTPAPDFFGKAPVEYILVNTANGRRAEDDAVIVVQGVDDAPEVTDKDLKEPALNLDEDQAATFDRAILLDRLADVDGEALSIVGARMLDADLGSVALTADGGVRFEPAADYVGEAPLQIDVTDRHSTVSAVMTPRLWPINDAPQVRDDHAPMDEDTTLSVAGANLLANDVDVDGPHEELRIVGPWATSAGDGHYDAEADTLRYTPPADAFGDAWVDYIVEDGHGAFSVARLNVTIENVYDPVQAVDDVLVVQEDTDRLFEPDALTGNDRNPDQGPLKIAAIDEAGFTHGQLALTTDGRIDYHSEADYAGEQSFAYTVEDAGGHRSSATVRFIVEAVNDAPRITDTDEQLLEDHVRVFEADALLGNAFDVEDDWMQLVGARTAHGTVDYDAFAGEITFTPTEHLNTDLNGGPLLFEYLVRDEKGAESWGTVDIDVLPVNDAPQAGDDVLLAWESGPGGYVNPVEESDLLANDIEVDGEAIRIDQVTQEANGTVALDTVNRTLGYRADSGFTGQDEFTYRVTDDVIEADGTLSADTGTVTVQVLDNRPPEAHDFAAVASEDTILEFDTEDFMAHVHDPDLELLELPETHRIIEVNDPVNGQASLETDGSVRFIPDADYNSVQHGGTASFDYVVEDIVGNRSEATASISYTPVNDDPVAVDDLVTQTIYEEQTAFIDIADLLANDFDVDDNPGESSVVFDGLVGNRSGHGSIAVDGDRIRYVGDTDYFGSDSFQYRIADGEGGEGVGAVQFQVTNVNDAPVVEFDSAQADDSGTNTLGGLLNNDFDADGDTLRIVNPSHGSVASGGTAIRFNADNRGHDYNMTITYGVTDGQETVQSRGDVHVMHINRPPTSLTQIQTDADSVFVAGNDPDTPDPTEAFRGGTVSFMGYSWAADTQSATGSGAGQNGLFIDLQNQFNHPVAWPDPNQAVISGTGTFSYTIEVSDGENERFFNGSISTPISLRNTNFIGLPVVIDINRDGLNLLGSEDSGAAFDWTGDGKRDATGWIAGEGDALLAYDHDGDGRVARADEISFVQYLEGAQTDLEGLRAFDSTGDGVFDADDDQWSRFGLWMDDGDANFQDGELVAMEESGIESLTLASDDEGYEADGNTVFGMAAVTYSDGTTGLLGDVGFAVDLDPDGEDRDGDGRTESSETEDTSDDEETGSDATSSSTAPTDDPADDETNDEDDFEVEEHEALDDSTANAGENGSRPGADEGLSDANAENAAGSDLPDDEELDRMAGSDNAQAATRTPEEPVTPVDADAMVSDTGAASDEQEDSGKLDMAA